MITSPRQERPSVQELLAQLAPQQLRPLAHQKPPSSRASFPQARSQGSAAARTSISPPVAASARAPVGGSATGQGGAHPMPAAAAGQIFKAQLHSHLQQLPQKPNAVTQSAADQRPGNNVVQTGASACLPTTKATVPAPNLQLLALSRLIAGAS